MFDQDDEVNLEAHCPRCMVGRTRISSKPFLKLYRRHLFTIPDALCYECDVCGYYEFDDTNFEIISDMIFAASPVEKASKSIQSIPPIAPDEPLSAQSKTSPA